MSYGVNGECTRFRTAAPTADPTGSPTETPTAIPSNSPTPSPPTFLPTSQPTKLPTQSPTAAPSNSPTRSPPTVSPTADPTEYPTDRQTAFPSSFPTLFPTAYPTYSSDFIDVDFSVECADQLRDCSSYSNAQLTCEQSAVLYELSLGELQWLCPESCGVCIDGQLQCADYVEECGDLARDLDNYGLKCSDLQSDEWQYACCEVIFVTEILILMVFGFLSPKFYF